ncbi:MAG: matrixin family metalloprotease [Dehalococcoidales bacterium]|nr:MAG: matrixin family metalloprotease [Dehalococcoidales bacterium]
MTKGRIIALFISVALVLGLALPVVAAGPPENPGKGPSGLTKIVFVHYPKGVEAKGGIPGKPDGGDAKADKEWYRYRGVHWVDTSVTYKIEDVTDDTFEDAIEAAFQTWDVEASISFTCIEIGVLEYGIPSSFFEDSSNPNGTINGDNEVGWMSFSAEGLNPNAIAVTAVWIDGYNHIVEADMAMNTDLPWAQDNSVTDPDNETADTATAYDVQNIVTHEAGHFLMLEDLYSRPAGEQTMYGRGSLGELKKRSLEDGDIAGILAIYGP